MEHTPLLGTSIPTVLGSPQTLMTFETAIDQGTAYALLVATTSCTIPFEGDASFIPAVQRATERGLPVFLLRTANASLERVRAGTAADYRMDLSHTYGGLVEAIAAGATPLEQPDTAMFHHVLEFLEHTYAKRPEYHEGIAVVAERFNSPEFMEQIERIRTL